jgi:hypothetical protein
MHRKEIRFGLLSLTTLQTRLSMETVGQHEGVQAR